MRNEFKANQFHRFAQIINPLQTNLFVTEISSAAKPFLRWAGGKTWLVRQIQALLPKTFNNYHEPFLGGGAVFLHIISNNNFTGDVFLSDLNEELINAYVSLRNQPNDLFGILRSYSNESECYYRVRSSQPTTNTEKAAKFIYLNRTSYNGIYRVNTKGMYNVPFGRRSMSVLFEYDNMKRVAKLCNSVYFSVGDFFQTVDNIKTGDLVFLDPPYTVAHENNGFLEYNKRIFAWEDQVRLKEYIEAIKRKGAYFLLTNAAHTSISQLYDGIGKKKILNRYSTIGGKGASRKHCNEFVYFNY